MFQKPNTYIRNDLCPFCNLEKLFKTNTILDKKGSMILMENLYPCLSEAYQLVLIEHNSCDYNITNYTEEYLQQLIKFGYYHWKKLSQSGLYKSVVWFKNHGKYSSGTLQHSHMQIIGLNDIDYKDNLKTEDFIGDYIYKDTNIEVNLSTFPKSEIIEFNIIIKEQKDLNILSQHLQKICHYIIHKLNPVYQSYNIYFYEFNNSIIAKVSQRTITSTLFIGYSINSTPSSNIKIINEIKKNYY